MLQIITLCVLFILQSVTVYLGMLGGCKLTCSELPETMVSWLLALLWILCTELLKAVARHLRHLFCGFPCNRMYAKVCSFMSLISQVSSRSMTSPKKKVNLSLWKGNLLGKQNPLNKLPLCLYTECKTSAQRISVSCRVSRLLIFSNTGVRSIKI